jgi:hypothetical protein
MDQYTGYLDGDDVVFRIIKTQLSTRLGNSGLENSNHFGWIC